MKYLERKIDKNKIEVVCFSDWHVGSPNFEIKIAQEYIKYINDNENVYVMFAGDATNCALKNSKSDVYSSLNPQEEIDLVCSNKLLGSIKKEKWIYFCSGNHGNRVLREVAISVDRMIASRLGIEDLYGQFLGVVNIRLTGNSYWITVHHGSGGGGTFGAKANTMSRLSDLIAGVDICIMAHTHTSMVFPKTQYIVDKKHCKIIEQTTHVINSGSLHSYEESYAEEKMLKPSSLGQAIITLESAPHSVQKKITVRWFV